MGSGLRRAPQWLQELMNELTKPPYFLNQTNSPQTDSQRHYTYDESGISEDMDRMRNSSWSSSGNSTSRTQGTTHRATPSSGNPSSNADNTNNTNNRNKAANLKRQPSSAANAKKPSLAAVKMTPRPAQATKSKNTTAVKPESQVDEQTRAWQAVFRQADYPITLPALYGWNVVSAHRVANILRVVTEDGDYALKRTHLPPERVAFLQRALSHVGKNDFTRFASFILSDKDRPYIYLNGDTYYATKWLPGNHVNFASKTQVGQVAHSLAQYHEASKNFRPSGYLPPSEFRLIRMLRDRTNDLRELIGTAEQSRNPDSFDRLLAQLGPGLQKDAERSLRLVETDECREFLEQSESEHGLCHLDVIPNNFITDHNHLVWLLDFDLATYAPRVLDLSHLLRRSLQRSNWDTEMAYTCFLNFNSVRAIPTAEYIIVQAMLTFPYQAWRLTQTRYHLFRDAQQVQDLDTYAVQETRRQAFLTAYEEQITNLNPAE